MGVISPPSIDYPTDPTEGIVYFITWCDGLVSYSIAMDIKHDSEELEAASKATIRGIRSCNRRGLSSKFPLPIMRLTDSHFPLPHIAQEELLDVRGERYIPILELQHSCEYSDCLLRINTTGFVQTVQVCAFFIDWLANGTLRPERRKTQGSVSRR